MDHIYTPQELAFRLIRSCSTTTAATVCDFAAGNGALLKQAELRWPGATLYAGDRDELAIRSLRKRFVGARIFKHDFLGVDSGLPVRSMEFDLVLLNPPYTCRGGTRLFVQFRDKTFKCSIAMAFIARALPFLHRSGELLALLPVSCLSSEKDAELITSIRDFYDFEQLGSDHKAAFKGYSVSVALVRAKLREGAVARSSDTGFHLSPNSDMFVTIMRGGLSPAVARFSTSGLPFVHSTDLIGGKVTYNRYVDSSRRVLRGEAVLLPRVGSPSIGKVCLKLDPITAIISDCVIAISSTGSSQQLHKRITQNWSLLEKCYQGSCAPYITLRRLQAFLAAIGVGSRLSLLAEPDQIGYSDPSMTNGASSRMNVEPTAATLSH